MRQYLSLTLYFILFVRFTYQATTSTGSIELDEISFNKVINKFDASLVKFDVAYPYGEKHDAFIALAKESKDVDELLIAEVGVKDYGDKDNEGLAKKYGASKDNFPVVKLFLKGKSESVAFDDSEGFTTDKLRHFVRENTGIYLSLPGCLRELDLLVISFMKSGKDERKDILKKTEDAQKKLAGKDIASGKIYKTIMEKVIDKGDGFVQSEYDRVKKILNGKLSEKKKKELEIRLNILQSFQLFNKKAEVEKQEL